MDNETLIEKLNQIERRIYGPSQYINVNHYAYSLEVQHLFRPVTSWTKCERFRLQQRLNIDLG